MAVIAAVASSPKQGLAMFATLGPVGSLLCHKVTSNRQIRVYLV